MSRKPGPLPILMFSKILLIDKKKVHTCIAFLMQIVFLLIYCDRLYILEMVASMLTFVPNTLAGGAADDGAV